jgi:hypothetical protein
MAGNTTHFAVGDVVRVLSNGPGDFKGRTGIVTEIGPGEAEYRIEFEDGERPTTGYLAAACLGRSSPSVPS